MHFHNYLAIYIIKIKLNNYHKQHEIKMSYICIALIVNLWHVSQLFFFLIDALNSVSTFQAKFLGFPGFSVVKNLTASAGNAALIPGLERSPGGGNGN